MLPADEGPRPNGRGQPYLPAAMVATASRNFDGAAVQLGGVAGRIQKPTINRFTAQLSTGVRSHTDRAQHWFPRQCVVGLGLTTYRESWPKIPIAWSLGAGARLSWRLPGVSRSGPLRPVASDIRPVNGVVLWAPTDELGVKIVHAQQPRHTLNQRMREILTNARHVFGGRPATSGSAERGQHQQSPEPATRIIRWPHSCRPDVAHPVSHRVR